MQSVSTPNKIEDALPALNELVRRAVDGTVPPILVDYENQRILIRSTTASAATSVLEIALWGSITTGGVETRLSTANYRSAINVTGTVNSSGTSNWLDVTAGGLNITSTANFRGALSVTGNVESTGTVNVKANMTASALDILSAAPTTPRVNTIWKDNIIKAWASIDTGPAPASLQDSFNVSGITDNGVGDITIAWDTDFANATYALAGMSSYNGAGIKTYLSVLSSRAVGSARIICFNHDGALVDVNEFLVIAVGDQ